MARSKPVLPGVLFPDASVVLLLPDQQNVFGPCEAQGKTNRLYKAND